MQLSMAQYLRPVVPHTPAELISPEALAPILSLAGGLAPCSSSGFEIRLGEEAPVADFLVNVVPTDGSRAVMAGHHPELHPPDTLLESPVWRRVRDFCRTWEDPGGPLHERIRDMWLEFDMAQFDARVPIPGVFFGPVWESGDLLDTVARGVSLLRGPEGAGVPPALARCLAPLPGRPRMEQVGMMFSRPLDDLRLCIRDIPPRGLGGYLRGIGWPGRSEEVDALVEDLLPFVDGITLDIDVGEGVRPKIGLECILLGGDLDKARWRRWLDHLVARGLCTPAKREGLVAWIGASSQREQLEAWPENLVRFTQSHPDRVSAMSRKVNHLKFIHQPGQPLQVKAYLAIKYFWVRVVPSTSTP